MDKLYLLRSYGDFVVAISSISTTESDRALKLIASLHLMPLYDALCKLKVIVPLSNLCFEDFGITHSIMGCLTNKHLLDPNSLAEIRKLRESLNRNGSAPGLVYFEQSRRMKLLTAFSGCRNARYVHDGKENIYESYKKFLGNRSYSDARQIDQNQGKFKQILITPGSRKNSKALSVKLVAALKEQLEGRGFSVTIAGLPGEMTNYKGALATYSDFATLIQLLEKTDLLLSADSLPVHLSELMNKPHWIFYNGKINYPWLTPSAAASGRFSTSSEWKKILDFI